jgi:BirA family transcriptional regulator, biotin operon repressor / biotin---[acetyl-CoA-carboxylase] ligase
MTGSDSLRQLLDCLSDGHTHSGEALGEMLGISRAAVWRYIKTAQRAGIPLCANRGEGYRLEPGFELLNPGKIRQDCLPATLGALSDIDVFMTLDSTNSQVMRRFQEGCANPLVVLAEKQTAGRGRRGRVWHSPFAGSIYLTVGWIFTEGVAALEGLSLIVGLKTVQALQGFGANDLQLKWPNDVYWHQRKLAGILIDVQGDPAGVCQVAIGIGINVNLHETQGALIDQPWVDLVTVTSNRVISRNRLVAALLNEMIPALKTLPYKGFSAYQSDWQAYDLCYGHPVTVQTGNSLMAGRACGVNAQGAYGINLAADPFGANKQSAIQYVSGGEISLRLLPSENRCE